MPGDPEVDYVDHADIAELSPPHEVWARQARAIEGDRALAGELVRLVRAFHSDRFAPPDTAGLTVSSATFCWPTNGREEVWVQTTEPTRVIRIPFSLVPDSFRSRLIELWNQRAS